MKIHYLLLILCFVNLGCAQSKGKPITEFSQNDIDSGILVDVRTPQEYNNGHLDQAVNINLLDADFIKSVDTIHRGQPIYVYCKKGGRSAKAAKVLDSLGFKQVVDLEGGYDAFIANKKD
ncbi:rhodanese-like domain-containing protein [Zobellia amurskyensis]|uniref:Rhodanese-like domain-containing protein n=1 Tax=Zobellia amurskyensis TaxID=248905 RepID=A0A7X3D1H3_9FLAO|nr:rhodanese-like domain-containing protein [Zobellia amurskyensis]MUH35615.1 rhodanese-like domain-containing protein [Zobellia amurskyensis]